MNVIDYVNALSIDELRARLTAYMTADKRLTTYPIAIEVRANDSAKACCRYDVLFLDENGNATTVVFPDRFSRLIYIYTLLHPKGFQRRSVANNNYRSLCCLFDLLYFKDNSALFKTINNAESYQKGHFLSQYIAQSRKAVRNALPLADEFIIDRPQNHNGKVLIPFVAAGGKVTLDTQLTAFINL